MALVLVFGIITCTLILPVYFIYKPPSCLISYAQNRWPDVLWRVSTTHKIIALTIDDAPSEYTHEIMQVLQEHGAKATFFVIGSQTDGREDILKQLIQNDHELANHAMYDEQSKSRSDEELKHQIESVQTKLTYAYAAASVLQPNQLFFRPGAGFFTDRMRTLVAEMGYRLVLGSIYPHDPFIPYWRVNAWHILSMVRPGAIIICHDRRPWTAPMLRKVLPELKRRGYQIVTLTRLLQEEKQ